MSPGCNGVTNDWAWNDFNQRGKEKKSRQDGFDVTEATASEMNEAVIWMALVQAELLDCQGC